MSFSTYYPRPHDMRAFTGMTVTVHAPLPPQVDVEGYVLPPMYLCSLSDGSTLEVYADELGERPAHVCDPSHAWPCSAVAEARHARDARPLDPLPTPA